MLLVGTAQQVSLRAYSLLSCYFLAFPLTKVKITLVIKHELRALIVDLGKDFKGFLIE